MTWPDYVIIGIILVSTLISLVRGFVREALSLAFWVIAFWIAQMFFREFSEHLTQWIKVPSLRMGAAFAIIFLVVLILGGLLTFLIAQLIDATGLSGTDRVIGMLFGSARGVLLVAALIMLAGLTPFPNDPWWHESRLIGEFNGVAEWLRSLLPDDLAQRVQFGAEPPAPTIGNQKPAGG
ncbi:MAG: CvpA family protein [Gammaproteobacteria bacterium]|nr:CvpA family protein [Gammaproteobacteria bacterium]MBU1653982.1 CvpA family protein [Gammaproteobacteria bacterium]MBU1960466.1 CvpA family protein [Gammaproteobacteria bacterium]